MRGSHRQIPISLLRKFEPHESWLAHDSFLHGTAHLTRVFILRELICQDLESKNIDINRTAVRWAAVCHDVGRRDDGLDPEHGKRSAQWMRDNVATKMSPGDLDVATYSVHWHVPPDDEAPAMTIELQVLKDADGLDRVRLGDLDINYLRTDASKNMIQTAKDLCRLSVPNNYPDERESFKTVLQAAQRMELVGA